MAVILEGNSYASERVGDLFHGHDFQLCPKAKQISVQSVLQMLLWIVMRCPSIYLAHFNFHITFITLIQ